MDGSLVPAGIEVDFGNGLLDECSVDDLAVDAEVLLTSALHRWVLREAGEWASVKWPRSE